MTVENIVKKLLMKQVPPTYTQPSVAMSVDGDDSLRILYEIGTKLAPKLEATFTQNDAGPLTSIQFYKNDEPIIDAVSTTSPATYQSTEFFLYSNNVHYRVIADYAEGTIKKDNLGNDYPTGHIAAGSKIGRGATILPYRRGYFAGYTTNTDALNSATIRALTYKKNSGYEAITFNLTVKAGAKRVIIACPATDTGMTKVLNTSALNADVTSTFTKSTVEVEGANGYTAIAYNVWTFVPDVAYGQDAVLAVTLG